MARRRDRRSGGTTHASLSLGMKARLRPGAVLAVLAALIFVAAIGVTPVVGDDGVKLSPEEERLLALGRAGGDYNPETLNRITETIYGAVYGSFDYQTKVFFFFFFCLMHDDDSISLDGAGLVAVRAGCAWE